MGGGIPPCWKLGTQNPKRAIEEPIDLLKTLTAKTVLVFLQTMGDQDLPGVLVAGLGGSYGICEDHVGDLQKHFNLITMQEFLENKMQFGPKIQAVYIWGGKPAVDQELLGSLPSLKIIASAGVGLDHLDLKLIASFGVKVANTPQAVSNPTADMGMALLLAAARRVVEGKQPLEMLVFQREQMTDT